MENPGSSQVKAKPGLWILIGAIIVGGLAYGAGTLGYLDWLHELVSPAPAEIKNAKGMVRDLKIMYRDEGEGRVGERLNIFLLEGETGELVPLVLDYDNHGLKNGDRVSVTYAVDNRRHQLTEEGIASRPTYTARLNRVIEFKLVKD